jgi:hypothetical protein
MDQLAQALAEAIKTGSAMAPQALVGYYAVRVVEALAGPMAGVLGTFIVCRCILLCTRVSEYELQNRLAREKKADGQS